MTDRTQPETDRRHTVEKIGGTSMSRLHELRDALIIDGRKGAELYNRIFVVSAFGGVTDMLLENKKTNAPGVYAHFANADTDMAWSQALNEVAERMMSLHAEILDHPADLRDADDFVRERIEGARGCLIDLQRLCSYGHFHIDEHLMTVRELLSGLGEAHSALVMALLLRRSGVNARAIDLTGWRDNDDPDLEDRLADAMKDVNVAEEMPILTGYARAAEGLMKEFDRGYTEVTFSRVAALTGAAEAIIHKEFHLSSADPKLVGGENVRKLGRTNYDVADQLSNLGMEAIHPKAAKILRQNGIPLRVTNAFEPKDPGTLIDEEQGSEPRVEMVTGLGLYALELHEPDMVGVKGYDAKILDALTRHAVRIVSKTTNANTVTHYVDASLKSVRRVERDLAKIYPNAAIKVRNVALVSALGRSLKGLKALLRGLSALDAEGIEMIAAQENGRNVDVQFVVPRDAMDEAIKALHRELVEEAAEGGSRLAA